MSEATHPAVMTPEMARWPADDTRSGILLTLLIAAAFSTAVFLPQTGFKGQPGGEMFQGDTLNFWLPQYSLLEFFVSHGVFSGIDYTTQNGAAEWFLRPNLIAYHPLYLLNVFLTDTYAAADQAVAIVYVLWFHALLSLYCLIRICRVFLRFDWALSTFVAVGFTFSGYLQILIGYVPYGYIVWLLPPIVYGSLSTAHRPIFSRVVLGSTPVFCSVLSGYLPLSLFSMGIAWIFVALYVFVFAQDERTIRERIISFLWGNSTFLVGAVFVFFFLFALQSYLNHVIEPAYSNNIAYSAYDLAESPASFFRIFSGMITLPGPYTEFTLSWGWIVIAIIVCYIVGSRTTSALVSKSHTHLLASSWTIYLFFALIIYGSATALSALFYYFAPIVGFMHIYQRFLPIAQLFLMLGAAVMLSAVSNSNSKAAPKFLLAAYVIVALLMTWIVAGGVQIHPFGVGPHAIMEILYACVFLFALTALPRSYAIWAATLLMFVTPLERVYNYVTNNEINIVGQRSKFVPLDETEAEKLDKALESFKGSKAVIKYVDITPGIYGSIPENYPWFRANRTFLSTYTGYDFHVGVKRDYRLRNPTGVPSGADGWRVMPDPKWIRATGADAIIFQEGDIANNPELLSLVDRSDPSKITSIRDGYTLAPLRTDSVSGGTAADNGFFRITQGGLAAIKGFSTNYGGNFDFEVFSERGGQLEYLFWPNERLKFEIDGRRIEATRSTEGLQVLALPPGNHKISVRYDNLAINLFLIGYILYAGIVIVACGVGFLAVQRGSWKSWNDWKWSGRWVFRAARSRDD